MIDLGRTKWRLITLTYNVNGQKPDPEAVPQLLENENLAGGDFVAIGLQELTHSDVGNFMPPEETWAKHIADWMTSRGSVLLKRTYLASNMLLLFTRIHFLTKISSVDFRYIRATMGGLAGYKGSIAVRIVFGGDKTSICFVTSHMFHSEKFYWKRAEQYKNSYSQCTFRDKPATGNDFVMWMGDLNWRVDTTMDAEKVAKAVSPLEGNEAAMGEYIQANDQLSRAMELGHAFNHFVEGSISFLPTYRLLVGTTNFDLKRVPSWCDRVLYKEDDNLALIRYNSYSRITLSDHLPVIAEFECSIDEPLELELIHFLPLQRWYSGVPLSCRFRFGQNYWRRDGSYKDWIGIYENVTEVENPLKYVFALTTFDELFEGIPTVVAEFSALDSGIYRIGYFSYNRGCLIALSNPFVVSLPHLSTATEALPSTSMKP
ncbi:hypothetical protein L596_024565 [Steinernema carpocapsae]|uniref:Inositol polyphosphate-related phosphatase domain-containing protein n=1 Tax=Steinernema carpocapsae TaxID=34508 RepID=A0A4U5MHF4_STECR|nr:hypothetical protein L596_024565 [Steinernema carpocapsae]